MIVDTSALVAILRCEDEAIAFRNAIAKTSAAKLSAGSYLETCIVISGAKRRPERIQKLRKSLKH